MKVSKHKKAIILSKIGWRKWPMQASSGTRSRDHITPVLRQFHWLQVRQRVEFKLAVLIFKSWVALRQTTASLSAPPAAAASCGLPASKRACYNVSLHVWEIGCLLLQSSDCGTVSQQNYDNLEPDLSFGQFLRALKTHLFCCVASAFVTFCFTAPCINIVTYLHICIAWLLRQL